MKQAYAHIKLLRPWQWTKNVLVFAALLFSEHIFDVHLVLQTVAAFLLFCLLSSSVYVMNDILDIDNDRNHPVKKNRPLPSGRISISTGWAIFAILAGGTLLNIFWLSRELFYVSLIYFVKQIAYSLGLKKVVVLDVLLLSFGFLLRVIAGALVINVEISSWLIICTFFLALFLSLCKRRNELTSLENNASEHRQVLAEYSPYLLDQMVSVVTASAVISYAMYTLSQQTIEKFGTTNLIYTVPFVVYGIFRYLYLVHKQHKGGAPEMTLLTDIPLISDIILWIVAAGLIIYL
ncbi:MAG: decaprenyl-phosphate phosphoribosyltransferase [Chitinivibrionales bacterium]|nr:decaprenyl-phosphate phosphoribosyltransferase [Chitinivibrionales bacterium]